MRLKISVPPSGILPAHFPDYYLVTRENKGKCNLRQLP